MFKLYIVISVVIFSIVNKPLCSLASPIDALLTSALLSDDDGDATPFGDDYDLHYDQRQNGTENYRLNVNGVLVAVPAGASSSSDQSLASLGLLASSYLVNLAEATGSMDDDDDDDDDADNGGAAGPITYDEPYRFELSDPNIIRNNGASNKASGGGSGEEQSRQKSTNTLQKIKKNKHKLRIGHLIEYLKRSRN